MLQKRKKEQRSIFEKADGEAFLSARRAGGVRIGLGVALILLGISALLLLEHTPHCPREYPLAVLFVCIAIAVALFIFRASASQYETLEQNSVELSGEATVWATSRKKPVCPCFYHMHYHRCHPLRALQRSCFLLIANTLGVSLLFLLIAIGCFCLSAPAWKKDAYNILLSEGGLLA